MDADTINCVTTQMYNISPSTGNRGVGPRPVGLGVTIVTEEVSKKIGLARGGSWEGASGFGERETGERKRERKVIRLIKGIEAVNTLHPFNNFLLMKDAFN